MNPLTAVLFVMKRGSGPSPKTGGPGTGHGTHFAMNPHDDVPHSVEQSYQSKQPYAAPFEQVARNKEIVSHSYDGKQHTVQLALSNGGPFYNQPAKTYATQQQAFAAMKERGVENALNLEERFRNNFKNRFSDPLRD